MTTKTKTPVEPKHTAPVEEEVPPTSLTATYNTWVRQVVEAMLEGEQKWLELAAEQNELTLKALKEGVEFFRTIPAPPITEMARRGEERLMAAQRRWVDSTTRQRERMLREVEKAGKEAEGTPTPNFRSVTDFAREQVEGLVEARNRWLDFLSKQNTLFIQGIEETFGIKEATPAANRVKLVEETVDNYVDVQKRLLKVVTPPPAPAEHPKPVAHPKGEVESPQAS
ncbi:MAG: hypothetical protein J0I20_25540 [Chloroflexi bacterium]|nr:hypothetical protein [Chloroflexota bacterium]OJW01859.1 MAG: hypothetical protein BGO39_28315 [Chloroflexi bacterium 54-19]